MAAALLHTEKKFTQRLEKHETRPQVIQDEALSL